MGLVKRGNVWWMKWFFRVSEFADRQGHRIEPLADAVMAKVKVQLIEAQYFERAEDKSRTFQELMDRFEREHLVKLASRATGQVFVKRFRAFFGDRTLAEITPKLIVDYKSRRYATGVKGASINRELTCLRKAFSLAKREWEWCRDNPVSARGTNGLHGVPPARYPDQRSRRRERDSWKRWLPTTALPDPDP